MNLQLFLTIVFAGLVLLKVAGMTTLSWFIVLLPLTILLVVLALCGGVFVVAGIAAGVNELARRRRIALRQKLGS